MAPVDSVNQLPRSKLFKFTRVFFIVYNMLRAVFFLWALTRVILDTWYQHHPHHQYHESSSQSISTSATATGLSSTGSLHHLLFTLPVLIIEASIIFSGMIGAITLDVNYLRIYSLILTVSSVVFILYSLGNIFSHELNSIDQLGHICFFITSLATESIGIVISCMLIHFICLHSDHQMTACDTIYESVFAFL